jgi:O-antigen/teichoic acid export membrane protein
MNLKSLAKDTAIYGLSSIVGRFLNYLLVPVYTRVILAESGGYGIVTNLYAYTALLLAILTFGMETTLFRFCNKDGEDEKMVYSTILRMVAGVSILFFVLVMLFLQPVSAAMGYADHPEYVGCMAAIVALDAFQAIMFSRLRQQKRPLKFMTLKFAFIFPNILLNLFIFLVLPKMGAAHPELLKLFVKYNYGVGLIFFANLLCTGMVTFGFLKEIKGIAYGFDGKLAKRLLGYSWPLLILSLVGVFNQVADKIIYPLVDKSPEGMVQLGIYGACVKIAMIMALLTQAFRYAYEPIVFSGSRDKNSPETLADGMKYFVVFTLLAFLAVIVYLPLIQLILGGDYRTGIAVVPIVMMAEIFMGIYFNLSFWYKLSDQTLWGAVMSAIGAGVMVAVNVFGIPRWGYMACAWGGFAGYGTAMLLSYFIGQKKYPIKYDMRAILGFFALAGVIFAGYTALSHTKMAPVPLMGTGTLMILVYCGVAWKQVVRR